MAGKRGTKRAQEPLDVKTSPVGVDLMPTADTALRAAGADNKTSQAALARKIISEQLGFRDDGSR
jgi:hypothetical protein